MLQACETLEHFSIKSRIETCNEENENLYMTVRFITPKHLEPEMIRKHHHTLVNAELRWRHLVPEEDANAILGKWNKSWIDNKSVMFATAEVWGETEEQRQAQTLIRNWIAEREAKEALGETVDVEDDFGVSAGFLRIRNDKGVTKRVLFREGSLTPKPKDNVARILGISSHPEGAAVMASEQAELVSINSNASEETTEPAEIKEKQWTGSQHDRADTGQPIRGVENTGQSIDVKPSVDGQPITVNINVGASATGSADDSKVKDAAAKLQEGVNALNAAIGGPVQEGVAAAGGLAEAGIPDPSTTAPSPEEFAARQNGETPDPTAAASDEDSKGPNPFGNNSQEPEAPGKDSENADSQDSSGEDSTDEDELSDTQKAKQTEKERKRKTLQTFETVNTMTGEATISTSEVQIQTLEAKVTSLESTIKTERDKGIESELMVETLSGKVKEQQAKIKTFEKLGEKVEVLTKENGQLKDHNQNLKLLPKRVRAAQLYGCENDDQAKAYMETIVSMNESGLDILISSLEKARKNTRPSKHGQATTAGLEGDQKAHRPAGSASTAQLSLDTPVKELDAAIKQCYG